MFSCRARVRRGREDEYRIIYLKVLRRLIRHLRRLVGNFDDLRGNRYLIIIIIVESTFDIVSIVESSFDCALSNRRLNEMRSGRKIRYQGYNNSIWERQEAYSVSPPSHNHNHGNGFHSMHSAPPSSVSPLQPALMVDVSQVPLTVPMSVYTGPPLAVCQSGGTAHSPSQMHNVYPNPLPPPSPFNHCSVSAALRDSNRVVQLRSNVMDNFADSIAVR